MDLRAKLARLKPSSATRGTGLGAEPAAAPSVAPPSVDAPKVASVTARCAREGAAPEPQAPPADDKIAELRARLAELVARSREKAAKQQHERRALIEARLREAPLPFDEHDTPLGPLHVRVARHPASHRVGRVPLAGALDADPGALAALALDPSLRDADPRRALFVDTESTGLAGGTGTIPFLVGLAWFEQGELHVEQLLLRRLGEEAPILARVADRIAASSMLVSFNGKAFDLPLLRTRFVMNRLAPPPERPHLDLVHLARRVHRAARGRGGVGDPRTGPTEERWIDPGDGVAGLDEARRGTSCRLVALERQILGFARVDDVPSSEVPARYGHFLRTGDADAIRSVCDHNLWDVVSMAALVSVYAEAVRALDERDAEAVRAAELVESLDGRDFVGLARTLRRAGDLRRARKAADVAVSAADARDRDLERVARATRGLLAKGTRDTETALLDFGVLAREHDDRDARLELAKLFEHRLRDPLRALEHVMAGTSEDELAAERRRARLEKKAARAEQLELVPARSRASAPGRGRAKRARE